jgi:hypothetical protein
MSSRTSSERADNAAEVLPDSRTIAAAINVYGASFLIIKHSPAADPAITTPQQKTLISQVH